LNRRDILKTIGVGASSVALAGCQSEPIIGGSGQARNRRDYDLDDGPLSGETIKVGVLCPDIEGFYHGKVMWQAAKMIEDLFNKSGGIAGAELRMLKGDTVLSAQNAREEFIRFATSENVDAVTGGLMDSSVLRCYEPMRDHEVPFISNPNQGLRQMRILKERYDEFKLHFRPGPMHGGDVAKTTVEVMNFGKEKLGWDTIGILSENMPFFDITHNTWMEELSDDFDIVMDERPSQGTSNWTPFWDELESQNADVALTVLWLTGTEAVTQWANQERQFELGGILGPAMEPPYWGKTGGRTRYGWTMDTLTATTAITNYTQQFVKEYYNRYKPNWPTWAAGFLHDSMMVYRQSIEDAVQAEGLSEIPDPYTWHDYMLDVEITDGRNSMVLFPWFEFNGKDAKFPHTPKFTCASPRTCDDPMGFLAYQQWQKDPDAPPYNIDGAMQTIFPLESRKNEGAEYHFPHWIDYPSDHPANNPDSYGHQPDS
jgi:branched-chain amino acid transport system substrate-binding protein